jgi:hypothetical protein
MNRTAKELNFKERKLFIREFYEAINKGRDFEFEDLAFDFPYSMPWIWEEEIVLNGQSIRECAINYASEVKDQIIYFKGE